MVLGAIYDVKGVRSAGYLQRVVPTVAVIVWVEQVWYPVLIGIEVSGHYRDLERIKEQGVAPSDGVDGLVLLNSYCPGQKAVGVVEG